MNFLHGKLVPYPRCGCQSSATETRLASCIVSDRTASATSENQLTNRHGNTRRQSFIAIYITASARSENEVTEHSGNGSLILSHTAVVAIIEETQIKCGRAATMYLSSEDGNTLMIKRNAKQEAREEQITSGMLCREQIACEIVCGEEIACEDYCNVDELKARTA